MPFTRRRVLQGLGAVSVAGLTALAGCSSSCPDADRPDPESIVSFRDEPVGPFETPPSGIWNGPHAEAGNRGYADGALPTDGLGVRWRTDLDLPPTDTGGLSASAPTVGDGAVFVADERRVHALSVGTGEIAWRSDPLPPTGQDTIDESEARTTSPAVGPTGTVYVGTTDGLVALDGADGSVRWRVDDLIDVASPAVLDGTVYALGAESLVAVGTDGTERWRRSARRQRGVTPPAVGGDRLVYASDASVVAVDVTTGEEVWERDRQTTSYPVIDGDTCFVGNAEGLHALDTGTGTDRWTFTRGDYRALVSPVLTPDTIYAVERPGEAGAATYALEREDGEPSPRWCSYVGSGAVTAATDAMALTILSLGEGPKATQSVVAFSANRGETHWALEAGSHPRQWVTPPAVVDGAVVATTRGGTTVAFGGTN
ncbi:outer membrane protein assembly factor BamB family protein [Halanaeroarchaeum sulfurireducens]|uniref:Quinohemoprotein alcohol dehydrogenase n=1 Tax=Halanaeroarchaeum sulfurireducens TaxID=1604004 RepID=A0A0F7PBX3_9EURY|nr:PQQ-binding-like beta-propeller repeat protein [Halanaeroarchaeum sulfurireducens]AKH98222.1 quinohemoprotein alcohol dehydrogenase [Halanaeroarchaeum sulfurireducens]ALG82616.1 quinohemoprotein alcohol dehydrogenase [Halanaeroarchaeum sulfurireducens]